MAAQVIAINAPSGLSTPTLRVFADGSDAQVSGSPFTLVEATNRKGYYTVSFTGTLAGLHLAVLYTGSNPIGAGWVQLVNADGTYTAVADRQSLSVVGRVTANTDQLAGQTVNAAAAVTFPSSVGTSTLDAAGVRSAVGLASANLDTQLADLPTVAEFTARTLAAAEYATATALATVDGVVDAILVDTDTTIPSLISDVPTVSEFNARTILSGDYATAANLATVASYLDTEIQAILEDTGTTLPALIADVPTVSEFEARTLLAADYATATALADVPTVGEFEARTILSASYATATAATAIQTVTDRLDGMLELDGSVYRYTVNALEQAPAGGGGGGGTDWNADERTAIRTILGIPTSGTTPVNPSAGVLDSIDTVTTKLNGMLVLDGSVYQFTENALQLTPCGSAASPPSGGGGSGATLTPLTSGDPYCSVANFLEFVDWRVVADWITDSDTEDRPTLAEVTASTRVVKALMVGTGDVEAACLPRRQYNPATLLALNGAAKASLEKVTAGMACWMLMCRRYPDADPNKMPAIVHEALRMLDRLRVGELVFGTIENTDAGAGMSATQLIDTTDTTSTVNEARRFFGGGRNSGTWGQ